MRLRVTYTESELAEAVAQMAHGAILVRIEPPPELAFDAAVELELTLPDGTSLAGPGRVLQLLPGHGVAVTLDAAFASALQQRASSKPARGASEEPTHAQKIQLALHGTRDQRNAILRDKNRALHVYVLKNPQMTVDDVLAIAKNPQLGPEMFKQIAERQDWFQRPQIALALARNPKVPGELAIRALAHVAPDALRQLAKGTGAPPHVVQAARRKVIDK